MIDVINGDGLHRKRNYNAIYLTGESGSVLFDFNGTTAVYATARYIPKRGEIMCKDGDSIKAHKSNENLS